YHPRWYNNILAQLGTTMPIVDQAALPTVTRFTLGSDGQAANVDISLTQNKADTLTVTYAKPKSKGSKTLIAGGYLNPSHDPKITIKAKIYKYNATKKKYVYKYTVTAKQTAAGLSTKWSISKKVSSKGKYKVKVYVSKHLWWAHRATSASKVGTIK
ncbi:MAG TPA: hypothetical protein VFG89_09850, partial [Coriobacteriia bacterium]|nr:hypothetical protein [Coriobacteriia bacterium]